MISINKAVGIGRVGIAKTVDQIRHAIVLARASRLVRKFSWKRVFRYAGVSSLICVFGLLVGALTAFMPPMVSIGIGTIPVVILIWSAPTLRSVPASLLRILFYFVVFVQICVPVYYAIQLPGLPWLSVRRIVVLCLIVLFFISVSGSAKVRKDIYSTLTVNRALFVCFVGYYMMCALSIFTSSNISSSISQFAEFTLNWYVPGISCVIALRNMDDVTGLFKLIAIFSLLIMGLGVADFIVEKNLAIEIMPKALVNAMMEANPSFADLVNLHSVRNGYYRASSIFNVPLSYGEFAAMVAPIGGYFFFHGKNSGERVLGVLTIIGSLTDLFVSGARGGSVAFLLSMPVLFALWVIRAGRTNPRSMIGPLGGAVAFLATSSLLGLVFAWGRLHKMVLGGGESASSDTSRIDEARAALPHIIANPLTGHGIGNSAEVIGYYTQGGKLTVDSSILTLLVETGIPGLVLFFGMLAFATWVSARLYMRDQHRDATVGAALASSFLGFSVYRLVLSQRENQPLLFILIGVTFVVIKLAADRARQGKPEAIRSAAVAQGRASKRPGLQVGPAAIAVRKMNV